MFSTDTEKGKEVKKSYFVGFVITAVCCAVHVKLHMSEVKIVQYVYAKNMS